jgi:uncharacterized delta-60 repeat protein
MRKPLLTLLTVLIASFNASAQPGTLDLSFNPGDLGFKHGDGFNSTVFTVVEQPDGKVLVGGEFVTFGDVTANRLIRLNADGTPDTGFNIGTGASGIVTSIAVLQDGRILVAGGFQSINGVPRSRVAMLFPDGSIDPSFDPGAGPSANVEKAIPLANGKVLIGGWFTTVSGTSAIRLARLNADGTLDPAFSVGTGPSDGISDMVLQPDGKLLVSGSFQTVNGSNARGVVRLLSTGAVDNTFSTGSGPTFSNVVTTMALQPDGKIIIGGSFTQFNGANRRRIARLNATGSVDTSFQPGTGADNDVIAVALQPDGKVLVTGVFTSFNNLPWQRLVRLQANGVVDNTFVPVDGLNNTGFAFHVAPDGHFLLGGDHIMYNGHFQLRIVKAFADGAVDTSFMPNTGLNGVAYALARLPDGRILVGGEFAKYNGVTRRGLCRVWPDGTIDPSFDTGEGFNEDVRAVAIQPDGRVVVAGFFTRFNGVPRNRIARLLPDGGLDESFDPGAGLSDNAHIVLLQSDGKILVGGFFQQVAGVNKRGIARLNTDGSLDATFAGSGVNGDVQALTFDYDGRLLVGGNYTSINSVNRTDIARLLLDGTVDLSFQAPASNSTIHDVIVQPDSMILICGGFSQMGASTRQCMARLGINGALDTGFNISNPNQGIIYRMELQPDGRVIAGGIFNSVGGTSQRAYVRLLSNGAVDESYQVGVAANNVIFALLLQEDGSVYIGGSFFEYNGIGRNRLARINGDFSTSITAQDTEFIHAWPNPCTDVLHMAQPFHGELYDSRGAWLRTYSNTSALSVQDLTPGVYLLRSRSGEVTRFVKE